MERTDSQLLNDFLEARNDAAFEELARRHAPLVMGVCRRLLEDSHEAEDALQATFVVLARSASSLRKRGSVASWLHGVALRVSRNAARAAATRREHERRAAEMARSEPEASWDDVAPVLDGELDRLPFKLRAPVVLCYLEGKTTEQAAAELGWTHATLRGRLAKARETLRGRVSRRGIVVGAALLATLITENASAAVAPPACLAAVTSSATAIAAGAASGLSAGTVALADQAVKGLFLAKAAATGIAGLVAASVVSVAAIFVAPGAPAADREQAAPVVARSEHDAGRKPRRGDAERTEPASPETADAGGAADEGEMTLGGIIRRLVADNPGWTLEEVQRVRRDGRIIYVASFERGDDELEIIFTPGGKVIRSTTTSVAGELPAAVMEAVGALHPGAEILEAERVVMEQSVWFELKIRTDGGEREVRLAPDGGLVVGGESDHDDGNDEDEEELELPDLLPDEEADPVGRDEVF